MNYTRIFCWTVAPTIIMAMASTLYAADSRYPAKNIQKIDIIEPSGRNAWEDKNWLDCDDVVLTEEDVRYALRHMRRISQKAYFNEDRDTTGCSGGATVTFNNGKLIVIEVEPNGYTHLFEATRQLEPKGIPSSFYDCEPCKDRKMALLQDAVDRATQRRLKSLRGSGAKRH